MAYGRKYYLEFLNVQNDVHAIFISEKDYEGYVMPLRGETDRPFVTNYLSGDDAVFSPIRAKECTLKFTAENSINLLDFYSEDDERFRIDHYVHSVNGTIIDKLLASFFLVQDSCEQEFTSEPFTVTLKGTDNLALLKDVAFTTESMPYHTDNGNFLGDISLFDYIKIAIQQTGLTDLPLRIYANVFENTNDDRTDSDTTESFQQVFMNTGRYLSDDGGWENLYNILIDIFTTFNCCFCQDNGAWNIFRRQESNLFTDNKIPGVEHNLTTGDKAAIELDYNWPVAFVPITQNFQNKIFLDRADHISRINRPFEFIKETFIFDQPGSYIANADLQLPDGAVPYETETAGDIRYDKYSIADYFPFWRQREDDTSYVQTEFSISGNRETDRYIVTPGISGNHMYGIQFKAIPVTAKDRLDFSLQFKMLSDSSETLRFFVKFILMRPDGQWYNLFATPDVLDGSLRWAGPNVSFTWDTNAGNYMEIPASTDKREWVTYDLFSLVGVENDAKTYLPLPVDGMLMVQVLSTAPSSAEHLTTVWKDINLTIENYINESTQIIGQYHNNEQNLLPGQKIKNNYDEEINIDDSPRNTIAGTLFTNAVTNFDYEDTVQGTNTEIGDVHFTRTSIWHRSNIDEERRLGEIMVYERMVNAYKARTVIDGSLYGTRREISEGEWNFVCLLCLLSIDSLPGLQFIFGVLEVDWANANYKAVLNELYSDDDAEFDYDYIFNYIYKTT